MRGPCGRGRSQMAVSLQYIPTAASQAAAETRQSTLSSYLWRGGSRSKAAASSVPSISYHKSAGSAATAATATSDGTNGSASHSSHGNGTTAQNVPSESLPDDEANVHDRSVDGTRENSDAESDASADGANIVDNDEDYDKLTEQESVEVRTRTASDVAKDSNNPSLTSRKYSRLTNSGYGKPRQGEENELTPVGFRDLL